ncbi:hypothetical protein [Campylobacter sp. MIT 21-1682]|nr:hypothetical protein [Campylobacter sp. MIT 21-1682]MCX2750574.1 hypothetical protein [Campylobacter sp. MIT 21-1682]
MEKLLQTLQKNLKPQCAKILLTALQNSNDESFFAFVLENLESIIVWLNSKEFEHMYLNVQSPPP